jgi:predicted RNase H-like HicB family nuclease
LSQVLHVPYTVEQVEGGAWRARAQPLPEAEASGHGSTREEAIADLREALAGLIAEFGVPEEMILTLNVAWPPPQSGPPSWWQVLSRWQSRRRRRRSQVFSLEEWEPVIARLNPDQERYVRLRWARSVTLMDTRHKKYVEFFYVLRTMSILGGVAVTALSGIGISGKSSSAVIRWTIFALGFLVAGSAALEQIGHYNQRRMLTRRARDDLLSVGFSHLLPAVDLDRFNEFRDKIEGILRVYNQSYNKMLSG